MFITLLVVFIFITAVCFFLGSIMDSTGWTVGGIFSLIIAAICLIVCICLGISVATADTIDAKIEMYEAQNAEIEEKIDSLVENYMSFETETYEKFKNEDAIALVSLFPELKSDELIQQQLSIYVNNNSKIIKLKEDKINIEKEKWMLLFK